MTIAIVVTFKPDFSKLRICLESLLLQVSFIILIKNSPERFDIQNLADSQKIRVIQLDKNYGIAFAQNRGIEKAVELGAEWILLSDQDSVFSDDYIQKMFFIAEHNSLQHIAALAPVFYDEIKNEYAGIMQGKTKKIVPESGHIYKVAHTISSGMLIPVTALQKCGLMREDFFIDFVDNEWCWRAFSCGLNIYCLADVVIHHHLGDRMEKCLGLNIVYRSLFRFYYIIRNGYYLLRHTEYLKGKDKFLFHLLMYKKIIEVLLLNHFDKTSRLVVRKAVHNGKKGNLIPYEESVK
ncbi:MAG TPA: glycosyltransferase family 2 protein [Candidatus Treponema faecavium]|nr:glycosyltransferase family 2 protein [Candidatus Treponema faecavium]